MPSLLNRSAVKKYIINKAKEARPSLGLTRVSGEALAYLEAQLRAKIDALVWLHPSNGVTFRP